MSREKASAVVRAAASVAMGLGGIWATTAAAENRTSEQNTITDELQDNALLEIIVCNPQGYDLVSLSAARDIFWHMKEIAQVVPLEDLSTELAQKKIEAAFDEDDRGILTSEGPKVEKFISILRELPKDPSGYINLTEQQQIEQLMRVIDGLSAIEQVFGYQHLEDSGIAETLSGSYQALWDYSEHVIHFVSPDYPSGCDVNEEIPENMIREAAPPAEPTEPDEKQDRNPPKTNRLLISEDINVLRFG